MPIHPDRTSGRDSDHCDPGGDAAAGFEQGKTESGRHQLPEQIEAGGLRV